MFRAFRDRRFPLLTVFLAGVTVAAAVVMLAKRAHRDKTLAAEPLHWVARAETPLIDYAIWDAKERAIWLVARGRNSFGVAQVARWTLAKPNVSWYEAGSTPRVVPTDAGPRLVSVTGTAGEAEMHLVAVHESGSEREQG